MPGYKLDNADDHLRRSVTELDAALVQLRHATDIATYWHDEMTAGGMLGIAEGFTKIHNSAEAIAVRLTGMTSAITAQAAVARTINDRTTPEHVIAVLTPITHALDTIRATGHAAIVSADNQSDLITRRLRGGKPGDLLHLTATTRQAISHARNHLHTANEVIRAAIRLAREAGDDAGTAPMVPHETEEDTHTGMPEPVAEDRAGAKVHSASEEDEDASTGEAYQRRVMRRTDDLVDAVHNLTDQVRQDFSVRPTGQHVGNPRPGPTSAQQSAMPDIMTGAVTALAMLSGLARLLVRRFRSSDEGD